MKRFYQLFLVLILVFALIGCESSPIPVKQEGVAKYRTKYRRLFSI